jgi:anti-sigma factor RsiW
MTEVAVDHAVLQQLVAAFADGELPPDEARVVKEHLRTCARCQRELALQQGLSQAFAPEPVRGASGGLRRRIEQIGSPTLPRGPLLWKRSWTAPAAAALVLIGLSGGTALLVRRGQASRPVAAIPLLRDADADCRRVMARNFPRAADVRAVAEGLPFPVRALDRPDAELFSTWKTTLAGSPAAGLAYRWRGIVVVQYSVPIGLLREQPEVGEALRRAGFYAASERGQAIVALLAPDGGGTLLLADAPLEQLRQLVL